MNTIPIKVGGETFHFEQHPVDANWNVIPIIYMFWVEGADGRVRPVIPYIGETNNACSRFPGHERWREAVNTYGATHVLARIAPHDEELRRQQERDLIRTFNPPMNSQHKPVTDYQSLFAAALNPTSGLLSLSALAPPTPTSYLANALRDLAYPKGAGLVPSPTRNGLEFLGDYDAPFGPGLGLKR